MTSSLSIIPLYYVLRKLLSAGDCNIVFHTKTLSPLMPNNILQNDSFRKKQKKSKKLGWKKTNYIFCVVLNYCMFCTSIEVW